MYRVLKRDAEIASLRQDLAKRDIEISKLAKELDWEKKETRHREVRPSVHTHTHTVSYSASLRGPLHLCTHVLFQPLL